MPLTDVKNTCMQDSQKIDTSNQAFHNEKRIIQDHVHLDTSMISEEDFSKVDHQKKESSLLTENGSINYNASNTLPRQIDNVSKQNLQKFGVSRKLFNSYFGNEINEDSDISLNKQETTEGIIKTTITSLEKKKHINDKKKSEISMTENHISEISQVYQYDSEAINIGNKNLTAETIKVSEIPSNINNKEIAETLQRDNCVTDNIVTSINSDDSIIIQDRNNERQDKCDKTDITSFTILIDDILSKIKNNSLTEECKDSDSHALDLPFSKFIDETLIDKKKLLPKLVSNSTVTLKGSPGMIIDLTNNEKSYGKGVNTLLDRFFCKHVINTKIQTNEKSEETEVHLQNTPNNPLPIKELLPYKLPANTDNPELNKPGAKLMRLKEDLKLQMTIKRNKEWRHREIELREKEEKEKEEWDEEGESDYDLDGQERIHDSELSDSGESEPEENDIYIKDKKRNKCLFADDEAEVTDDESSSTDIEETCSKNDIIQAKCNNKQSTNFKCRKQHIDDDASEIESDQKEEEEEEEDAISSDADIENESESDSKDDDNINICKNFGIIKNKKDKETKQSIEELQDDLNVINPSCSENDNNQLKNITIDASTFETRSKDNGLISEDKSNIPTYQQHTEVVTRSQIYKTPLTKTSMLDFVSPITQLSVLNTTLDSNNKDTLEKKKYPIDIDQKSVYIENTQSDGSSEYAYNIRNKNISKKKLFDDIKETVDDEYLMRLCSGKFESTQRTDINLSSQTNSKSRLCPENFNTKLIDIQQLESLEEENENSQDVRLILDEDSNNSVNHVRKMKQVGAPELKIKIVSSDDDDDQLDETDTFLKPRKRSVKRLHLSDSEEEDAQSSDEENENDMDKETEEQYVDYDSEENEMIVVPKKDIKKVAADFLEEEAELSESDWDSADEDEKDLDKLEYEEADDEHIDEQDMKNQLEKIHRTYMRQVLDEDKREVRLLQELLFEDGDLHTNGMGRERKFKWRNIDKLGSNTEISQTSENDGWIDVQEDEEEAKWSKLRQERDKFLEERMKSSNNEIEDELCDSQIFKSGLEALKKIKNNEFRERYASHDKIDLSENMEPIMPRNITDLLNGPNTEKKSQTIYYINLNNTSKKDNETKEEDQDSQTKVI
ncbi:claspin-like protein [Lasius niger]|uniref:Claspin-like protein n=1 Tax=Lasius niger TaxID=67767 RepID=A0A0J7K753_LASNI|nr:claspin-like protein [Lasius niger]